MSEISTNSLKIREMFSRTAPRYDLLNRILSLGIDRRWRRHAASRIRCRDKGLVLDIATGTGDMALAVAASIDGSAGIIGVDFCEEMIRLAAVKISVSPFRERIALGIASCESLPFRDDTFDSATIAFGIRNVGDRELGLREILRVLKPGGRLLLLEFSTPRSRLFRALYHFYFIRILPAVGGMISDSGAYRYLPRSVLEFPDRKTFLNMMRLVGFTNIAYTDLTFGIVTEYRGEKPPISSSHTPRP